MPRGALRARRVLRELQARCGGMVAARVIFAGFGVPDNAGKRGSARGWAAWCDEQPFDARDSSVC
jgi:hypothetical protein